VATASGDLFRGSGVTLVGHGRRVQRRDLPEESSAAVSPPSRPTVTDAWVLATKGRFARTSSAQRALLSARQPDHRALDHTRPLRKPSVLDRWIGDQVHAFEPSRRWKKPCALWTGSSGTGDPLLRAVQLHRVPAKAVHLGPGRLT